MSVQHRHAYQRTTDVAAVDQITARVGWESSPNDELDRTGKVHRIVLMAHTLGVGLRQSRHYHRAGSREKYQTIEMVQLLEDQAAITSALDPLAGHGMIAWSPSKHNASKNNQIQHKQDHTLHVAMGNVRDIGAVMRNDIVAKVGQFGGRFLGRTGKVHVGHRSAEYAHEHVAYPPQHERESNLEVGEGEVGILNIHGRFV